jgi:hypothetical protein
LTSKQMFFERMVKPTVVEFLEEPTDIRRGLLAAILLNQMADYWAVEAQVKPNEVRRQLAAQCPEIFLIWDIADASKHARLTQGLPRAVTQPSQVMRPPGLFEAPFGTGVFGEAAIVFVKPHEGPERELEPVVRVVLALWEERLSRAVQT